MKFLNKFVIFIHCFLGNALFSLSLSARMSDVDGYARPFDCIFLDEFDYNFGIVVMFLFLVSKMILKYSGMNNDCVDYYSLPVHVVNALSTITKQITPDERQRDNKTNEN